MRFQKERLLIDRELAEEDVIAVYIVGKGRRTCTVGFLPRHLAICRANDSDELYARIVNKIYTACLLNNTKHQKRHNNHGFCMAKILGNNSVFLFMIN